MNPFGLNPTFFVSMLINIIALIGWIGLAIVALRRLRHATLSDLARLLWAIFIVVVPIGGAVALFLVQPGAESAERANSRSGAQVPARRRHTSAQR